MRRREAFTLVEVLVSLGVMTIGAMALMAMEQQTTRANMHARTMTVATQIAQNVLERMKLEALAWNAVSTSPTADLFAAPSLAAITSATAGAFATLQPRTIGVRVLSNAFDYYGDDVDLTNASTATKNSVFYCASYRLSWIYTNFRAMRVDVRVWWPKEAPTRSLADDYPGCADDGGTLNPGGTRYDDYHVVYMSTVLRPVGT
jgi:type II secretory pathway pseudopilin PulG